MSDKEHTTHHQRIFLPRGCSTKGHGKQNQDAPARGYEQQQTTDDEQTPYVVHGKA